MIAPTAGGATGRRRLQSRVLTLIVVGVLAPLGALGAASWLSLSALSARLAEERQLLAASFADHLDDVVRDNLELLQGVAAAPRVDPADDDPAPEHAALRAAILHAHLMRAIFVVDAEDRVVAGEPPDQRLRGFDEGAAAAIHEAMTADRPAVGNLITTAGRHSVYVLVPISNYRGRAVGLVVGEIDPTAAGFAGLLRPMRTRRGGRVDLVDGAGTILASTVSGRQFTKSSDAAAVTALVAHAARTPGERPAPAAGSADGAVALAPLARAPWAVVMRERSDEAASAVAEFRGRLLLLGVVLVGLGAVFAWGAARSVTRPIVVLTHAAEQIGVGELSEPIPQLGYDEVGRLGEALESMRAALERSLDEVEQANAQLERRVDARTRELALANQELKKREHWRGQLLSRVIAAQEDERKRIARELHDETSQTLSVLAMGLETACATLADGPVRGRLLEAKALTVRALDELHRLIYDLRPSILDDLGLLPAIRWFAERHLTPLGITVRCECSDLERRLPLELAVALFRIVQEAITNIAKHAEAETVLVQCGPVDGVLVIEIEDDGRGFDPAEVSVSGDTARGLGLAGMRERVELVGGQIAIDSAPGRGVHVTVRVPPPGEAHHG